MERLLRMSLIIATSFIYTKALVLDLTLRCEGIQRKLGTSFERNILFEIDFFWSSRVTRMYDHKDGVRRFLRENPANSDSNNL
jgi:hypothetical protein